ncbi:aa3-type cytochrome c oxidase subunit IV [Novosphingobium mangrovi (ex Huang et al. 2023)]|uniref:Aa3-type cytochrome c oxidase subunit IV n=1 Tax=Novosphingobium mangrovi (ex Huang et al. 2023) TaxID=2976432 RepID=A0ABT2I3N3_9SPHN|nr:aa3-type cytochrome c oxidase subunit IV [Novosphingobium mangrovi (ex Huang et al. 2023)]MCT2399414.1 aa3-type cytochrome c oxidase subunit IV [Novosphingobium mangrovi (ex Huang et al. 2023)]
MTSGNDIKTAQATYNSFIKAATWGTGICIVIVAVVVGLISS